MLHGQTNFRICKISNFNFIRSFAGVGELAGTQACSIVMAYAATQFKVC